MTASDDLTPGQLDYFSGRELDVMLNVHNLKCSRPARVRLYDEVIKRVFHRITEMLDLWASHGHSRGALVLDGVDMRGADRPAGQPREPVLMSNDDEITAALTRTMPIGEGDMKLMALDNRVRELVGTHPRFANYTLALTSTIDTDTFMTMLLDASKRRVRPNNGQLRSLFCMREPASKRVREENEDARATYLCCDTVRLEHLIQRHLWSKTDQAGKQIIDRPELAVTAMLAFTSAAAICGCDFTADGLKGARFDHMWESLPDLFADEPSAVLKFAAVLDNDAVVARTACQGLYRICVNASNHMKGKKRYQKQAESVFNPPDELLTRSIWSSAYWAQHEFKTDMANWGFRPRSLAPQCDSEVQDEVRRTRLSKMTVVDSDDDEDTGASAPVSTTVDADGFYTDAKPAVGPVVRSAYFAVNG